MDSSSPRSDSLATLDLARARRLPFSTPLLAATQPGEITYLDVVSASHLDLPRSSDGKSLGYKHCAVFVDAFSGHIRVYFCKSQDEVPALTRFYLQELGTTLMFGSTFVVRRIHTDGGTAMNNADFERVLLDYGLAANVTSCPRTPSSNGVAEAVIKYLIQGTAQRLAVSGLDKRAWFWAMRHAAVSRNKLAIRQLEDGRYVTPHELFYGRVPSHAHSSIFGAPCSVLLLGPEREARGKFGVPATKGHVLGHGEDGFQWTGTVRQAMGYIVLTSSGKVVFSKHVRLDERVLAEGGHTPFAVTTLSDGGDDTATDDADDVQLDGGDFDHRASIQIDSIDSIHDNSSLPEDTTSSPSPPPPPPPPRARPPPPPLEPIAELEADHDEGALALKGVPTAHDPLRRDRASRSKTRASQLVARAAVSVGAEPLTAVGAEPLTTRVRADEVALPRSYKVAMASPHAAHWQAAVETHLAMHRQQGTFREIVVPSSTKVLPCQWVLLSRRTRTTLCLSGRRAPFCLGTCREEGHRLCRHLLAYRTRRADQTHFGNCRPAHGQPFFLDSVHTCERVVPF